MTIFIFIWIINPVRIYGRKINDMITHNTLALLTNVLNIIHPLPQYTAAFYSPQAITKENSKS